MTLLLTLASPLAIHQSSDYRLTPINQAQFPGSNDVAGSKQLTLNSIGFVAQICFTGVAQVGHLKTRDWISQIITDAQEPAIIAPIASEIAARGTKALSSPQAVKEIPPNQRTLTVIIAIVEHGKNTQLVMISNIDSWHKPRRPQPLGELEVSFLKPTRPMVRSFGCDMGLRRDNKRYLLSLLRDNQDSKTIKEALAAVNKRVAQSPKSGGLISDGCMVSSLLADGTSSAINFGEVAGIPDSFMGNFNVGQLLRKNLTAAPGKQIAIVQSASASRVAGKECTELLPEGELRTLHFSTPNSTMPDIANRFGGECDKLVLEGRSGSVLIRKNEPVTAVLNTISWELGSRTQHESGNSMFPTFRISNLPTVEGVQPRSWDYGFDVSAEQRVHTLTIRQNSMAFRSANCERPLSILGPTEELVMVAPRNGLALSVPVSARSITGTIEAEFLLRDFPELGPPTSRAMTIDIPKRAPAAKAAPSGSAKKAGRNEVCPCGSGKKFKKCHG